MNISKLYREYGEKFEIDNEEGGITYKVFSTRIIKIMKILKKVMNDKNFRKDMTNTEKIFYRKYLKLDLDAKEIETEDSKNFFFSLIRIYSDTNIISELENQYHLNPMIEEIKTIEEKKIDEFLIRFNIAYIEANCGKVDEIISLNEFKNLSLEYREKQWFIDNSDIRKFIEEEISIIAFDESSNNESSELFGFTSETNEDEIKKNTDLDINYNYKMIMVLYYRLCKCLEWKRDYVMNNLFQSMTEEMKFQIKNELFKIILKKSQKLVNNEKV